MATSSRHGGRVGDRPVSPAHASVSQTKADWINSRNAAFAFFGGISEIVVPDCLKSAVDKSHPWVSKINAAYQSWADYSGTVIIAARPRKPKDKAKAELGVLLVTCCVLMRLRHHTFFSLGQLNDAICSALAQRTPLSAATGLTQKRV